MIVAIVGPTGVGKTKLSVCLAKKYNAEIISSDSMQVYKKMDIVTAKVTKDEMDNIPHHLINIKDITYDYSVYDYQKDARKILDKLISENKNVIIVGGTGLYLKALLYDYQFNENNKDLDFSMYSNEELYNMVLKLDNKTKVHINNRQRLESFLKNHNEKPDDIEPKMLYDAKIIGLTTKREKLYDVIDNRVDIMFKNGLIKEAKYFYDMGKKTRVLNTVIGYKQLFSYFDGKISLDESIKLIKQKSRNYAKRQYTWFNNQFDVKWFDVNFNDFNKTVSEVLKYLENVK